MGSPLYCYKEMLCEMIRIAKQEEKLDDIWFDNDVSELENIINNMFAETPKKKIYTGGWAAANCMQSWMNEGANDMFNAGLAAMMDMETFLDIEHEQEDED